MQSSCGFAVQLITSFPVALFNVGGGGGREGGGGGGAESVEVAGGDLGVVGGGRGGGEGIDGRGKWVVRRSSATHTCC